MSSCGKSVALSLSFPSSIGRSWKEKVEDVRCEMKKKDATVLIVTALDEVACERTERL